VTALFNDRHSQGTEFLSAVEKDHRTLRHSTTEERSAKLRGRDHNSGGERDDEGKKKGNPDGRKKRLENTFPYPRKERPQSALRGT